MKKTFKRFLSVFLAVLMVTTVIPMSVYAAETEEMEVVQVSEIEESRDLYSKTYETSKDTNVVISAAIPLHYEEDGELKNIDNTLVKSEKDSSVLTNAANAYNVELPKEYANDSEIKVDYEDNSISFKLLNNVKASKGNIAETKNVDVDESNAESVAYSKSNIDKLSSAITYENLLPDTDFEYNVQPNALKENIILNRIPDAEYTVQYELNTGNLKAVLNGDNSITLFDGEKEVFFMEAPYMIDANDTISEDVAVSLEKSENGYTLTYFPDYSWLSSEDTAYPITIDPTITVLNENSLDINIEDTYVSSFFNEDINNEFDFVQIQNNEDYGIEYGYYRINNLPDLYNGNNIIKSSFNVFLLSEVEKINDFDNNIALYNSKNNVDIDNLDFSLLNWENKPEISEKIVDVGQHNYQSESIVSFDITNIVSTCYKSNNRSMLFALKSLYESGLTQIATCESSADLIPFIEIEYKTSSVINDSINGYAKDMSFAGINHINDLTGEYLIERTDFESNGLVGDIVFYYGNSCNIPKNQFLGINTSFNLYKTISKDKINKNNYILTNGDGSCEYINEESTKYTSFSTNEEDGTITVNYNEGADVITETYSSSVLSLNNDKSESDKIYVLTSCKRNYNDTAQKDSSFTITYSNTNNRITKVQDNISTYTFSYINYNNTPLLSTIRKQSLISSTSDVLSENKNKSPKSFTCKYEYKDGQSIIYKNYTNTTNFGKKTIYDYSNKDKLQITNELGNYYECTFNNNKVVKLQEFSKDGTEGDYLTFEYGNNTTTISNGKDTYTEYFDLAGNLESIVDQNGNATFAQYKDNLISKISETRNSARNIADFYGFESNKDSFFKTNNGTVIVSNDAKFNGNSSVKLTAPTQTKAVFDGKIKNLDKNSTYTVSMWVKKDESTDCSLTLTNGDSNGIFTTVNSQQTDGWQQFYCTIDTEESNYLNIALTADNSSSDSAANIYVDNMYIQKSPYLTNVNLLENGDFDDGLNDWIATNDTNVSVETEDANISTDDNSRLKIIGNYLSENTVSQTVPITATAKGTKYTYGGWLKTVDSLPAKEETDREISMSVYGISSDGTSTELDKTTYSSYLSNWQYIESELTLPDDNITQLKFVVSYNYQTGYAMFDGLSLSQDELYTIEFEYDENNEIKSIITNGTTVSLSEDENAETESNYNCFYEYDEYGNVVKQTETATVDDISKSIVSKFKYGYNGSLLTGEMGALGRWSEYKYDYFGNIASATDANGNTVQYEYDNFQNLSAIINQFENKYVRYDDYNEGKDSAEKYTLKVQYTYTGNRLDKIETGNIEDDEFVPFNTYAFEYDEWGNQINIYINDMENPYIHYEYDETNYHQLNSVSYINNQEIHYIYDDNGNIIYEYDGNSSDGDTLSYSYYYYDDGTCYGKKNLITGTIESYQDGLTTIKDNNGNILHVYGYDENGNLLEQIGDRYINTTQTDNKNSSSISTTIDNNNENVFETTYDDFGRISTEKISNGDSDSYILKYYTYYNNKDIWMITNSNTNEGIGLSEITTAFSDMFNKKEYPQADNEAEETNLVRYLTYYLVNDKENTKVKLNEYRYWYDLNGNILSYTAVTGSEDSIEPGNPNDDGDKLKLTAYNQSCMELGYMDGYTVSSSSNGNGIHITGSTSGILYQYDKHGNATKVTDNENHPAEEYLNFAYDEGNTGTAVKNCLSNIRINNANLNGENKNLNFAVSYDQFGNINNVSTDDIKRIELNDDINLDVSGVNLDWSRGSTLSNIKGNLNINYKLPLINKEISLPATLDLINYKYDDNNLRTNKSINLSLSSVENLPSDIVNIFKSNNMDMNLATADMNYIWKGGKLVGEEINCSGTIFEEGDKRYGTGAGKYSIVILYDQNGNAYGFNINKSKDSEGNAVSESQTFYYVKDAENTIRSIVDSEGNTLVKYDYDSYGMVIGLDNAPGYRYLMLLNPLAYRDYIYDIESGMYYLQSRYYAPYVGRFISPDSVLDTGSGTAMCTHLYSYCENNPTNYYDYNGMAKLGYYPRPIGLNKDFYDVFHKYLNDNYTGNINVYKSNFRVSGIRYLQIFIDANWKVIKSLMRDTGALVTIISLCCESYFVSAISLILAFLPYYTDNFPDNRRFRITLLLQERKSLFTYKYRLYSVYIKKL